jgi:hypothetical protein
MSITWIDTDGSSQSLSRDCMIALMQIQKSVYRNKVTSQHREDGRSYTVYFSKIGLGDQGHIEVAL